MSSQAPSKRGPFLREATGLVREISPLRAMFFNFCAMSGGIVVLNYIYSAFYPASPTFGLSSLDLAQILSALALIPYGLIFIAMVSRIPRTGGDYVFTSRIISPFAGWLETWTLLFANISIIGFELLQISYVTQAFFVTMGAIYKTAFWSSLSSFFSSPINQAVIGILLVALMGGLGFTSTRKFTLVTAVFAVLGVSGILLQLALFSFGVSRDAFLANFQSYTGVSASQVVSQAFNLSSSPLRLEPISFAILGPAVGFALFNLIGYQYSAYVAGELKGNIKRTGLVSILGSLWLYTAVTWILLVPVVFSVFGYSFLHAWAYLAFNAPSQAPLSGIIPQSAVLGLIAAPKLWPIWFYVTFVADVLMFSLGPVYIFMMSRIVFAWSMDRIVPGWFAEVNQRTATPTRIYVLTLLGGLIFFLMSFPPVGLNLSSLAYYSILLSALTWILPGFNAILMPFRKKELFEMGVLTKRVAGVPVLVWIGVIWLAFILPIYVSAFIQPLISGFFSSPTWAYATNTGVSIVALIVVVGGVIYFGSKYYNRRRGVDIDLAFKEIPPE
ncbi:hypothetical protein B9Q04_12185 [Candidatus Marsarchaeota G2 archaeon BE_D]|jgi:Amino acid permease.|uniref:Amino acid permease/ SLC12A domain-containing protein n=1 Tax=Candidatus Marsarchaeota G2 archaeon BE_D TaxID=1978158 RepID=A0A2R6C8M7_9ARCH|nr:MAG: hypothetical protein B9Q04_12185 [Candidatus Marsarchaeota G2 archaeon BE_D]